MRYISSQDAAKRWHVTDRTVRYLCAKGKVHGATRSKDTGAWMIPVTAVSPLAMSAESASKKNLTQFLAAEQKILAQNGIYQKVQIELAYHSLRIDGSALTKDQVSSIFTERTISGEGIQVDDIIEVQKQFRGLDFAIQSANHAPNERFIKTLHRILKGETIDEQRKQYVAGEYRKHLPDRLFLHFPPPGNVPDKMKSLLQTYNTGRKKSLEEIAGFYVDFAAILPFDSGNGRVARILLFKECLRNHVVPVILEVDPRYYLEVRSSHRCGQLAFLMSECLRAQKRFKTYLDYHHIPYNKWSFDDRDIDAKTLFDEYKKAFIGNLTVPK